MCKEWAIADVITWYESMPQDVLDQWLAFDAVEPIGCEWERHACVMAMLEAVQAAAINPHLKREDQMQPRRPQDFLPSSFVPQRKAKASDSITAFEMLAKRYER